MAPPQPLSRPTRPVQDAPSGPVLPVICLLAVLLIILYWRRRTSVTPETESLLSPTISTTSYQAAISQLPPPVPDAILLGSTTSISTEMTEVRRHSYPSSKSAIAAEKAAALKPTFGVVNFWPLDQTANDEEGRGSAETRQRRETIQIFAASQDEVPGRKGVWRRRTLEFG